ncbi:MAG: FtsH protease activity modulator HflK [bacterium]|nr:FtsH protease activity modulator HflK [bacterium]
MMEFKEINLEADWGEWMDRLRQRAGHLLGIVLLLVLALSSWFTVGPEEVGVVLRFGAYTRKVDPGLHLKFPFGIEQVTKVPVERQLKEEFGFRTAKAGVNTQYAKGDFSGESLMMTGDLNLADVEWIIQYRVADPFKYLFRVRGPRETLRDMTEAVMRRVVGDRSVNEVLTVGRQEVCLAVEEELQLLCVQYETGIKIEQVVLQDVNPPDRVKPAFNEVNEAQQEREKLINEARSEYNRIIPRARGEAEQTLQQAEGYAMDRVNRSRGEATRFNSLFTEYQRAPEVTRTRIYLETMRDVLAKSGRKVVLDEAAKGLLPLMLFDGQAAPAATGAGTGGAR